jgi:hypothetical protein
MQKEMMNIILERVFLLFYTVTICIAVQYECNNRNTSCGCGYFNVELALARRLNGENTIKHSWPMIVFLDFHRSIKSTPCTGSILNNYFILTTAHCVKEISSLYITIKAGIHYPHDQNATTREVKRVYLHPNYTGHADGYTNNIAVLELNKPLHFEDNPYVTPTCIPSINSSIHVSHYPINGTRLVAIGWQSIRQRKVSSLKALQQGEIFLIDNNDSMCQRSFIDPDKQFCAGLLKDGTG